VSGEPQRQQRAHKYANGVARQDEILDAAAELFAANGFGTVSLRDLAAAVGISHQGIRRHFGSIDIILLTLLERYETQTTAWAETFTTGFVPTVTPLIAERNQTRPGYVELFVALAGEATSPTHPAHAYFRRRYLQMRQHWQGPTGSSLPGLQLMAAWDGLQLHHLYAAEIIDVPALLRRRVEPDPELEPLLLAEAELPITLESVSDEAGYARGRAQRRAIIASAIDAFADSGFTGTTVTEVAERVGVSKSTLIHHFPTKKTLLVAVLEHRSVDRNAELTRLRGLDPWQRLLAIPDFARLESSQPGLAQLYCVLAGEAIAATHPGHHYFAQRLQLRRQIFIEAFRGVAESGRLADRIDPVFEGLWLAALWDGLLFQRQYQPDLIDLPAALAEHLASLGITADATP
jgi:AcrR family transcriptional regulator